MNTIKDTKGMALVICLLIMTVAATMGIGIATDSTIDGQISRNQRDMTKNFFIADGTNQLEVSRITTDPDLGISDITKAAVIDDSDDDDDDKTISGLSTSIPNPPVYRAKIQYHFYRPDKTPGNSLGKFNSFFYSTRTRVRRRKINKASIRTVQSLIGPLI